MPEITPLRWEGDHVALLDQTLLPTQVVWLKLTRPEEMAEAIRNMRIRGAPALGVAAAFALALAARNTSEAPLGEARERLSQAAELIRSTRPTARNLFWALERMLARAECCQSGAELAAALEAESLDIQADDLERCWRIGEAGAAVVPDGARVLTHCNAGALATAGYGTALGVIRAAARAHKIAEVLVDETRPLLQGARLTAWELAQEGIPARLLPDCAAGFLMAKGMVDLVVVGADRIARNGDVANKIGTYSLAVLARENGIPFYVAAPLSTADLSLSTGAEIPVEERSADEVLRFQGHPIAPDLPALNFAFDITPARFVTAIICEHGILRPPYEQAWPAAPRPTR